MLDNERPMYGRIARSDLDGSNVATVIVNGEAFGIALDVTTGVSPVEQAHWGEIKGLYR